ncbi:MAG TPA: adenylate/guanylate cyclase domain-containing protein [Chloroflexota bacterium]|nr:adenylate/guanylate cyclase domain-containing protein [Chloroflexota bacterium]
MLIRRSLKAGLITGALSAALMLVIEFFWAQLRVVWPVAYVPLFLAGVYAVRRGASSVATSRQAAVSGGVAGLAAAAVTLLAVLAIEILSGAYGNPPFPFQYTLVPVLLDSPFFVPPTVLFYDLPGSLPVPWPHTRVAAGGVLAARIPWTLPLWIPLGVLLSAIQGWAYYGLARQANLADRVAARMATLRSGFQTKLLAGFLILTAMIFAVGWLGWAATEQMHFQVHAGRAMQHLLDHALAIQTNLRAQSDALARLASGPDEAALEVVSGLGQKISADLTHLKTIPPPAHPAESVGAIGVSLRREAEKRLPEVREADSRFADFNRTASRVVDLYRAGSAAEAQALLPSLDPLLRAVDAPLWELTSNLNADLVEWATETDRGSHTEQFATMLLVLVATGLAFPLGYVFSQIVVRPVNAISDGLEHIGAGDFASRVQVENRDELGELAGRVNRMSGELDRLYTELRGLNENLEQKVEEQLQEIEQARVLKRYLSPQVADSIIAGQSDVKLATTRKNLTVCFADIRGFTGLSERMEPEELIDLLNEYFAAMTDVVFKHGGTLDKYLGDGMMVFFGDPVPYNDHAERAVRMAAEMLAKLPELQKQWFMEEKETLNIGIGISTGYVTVGNIGSAARLEYTVIGNNVNLASRLADMAGPGQILVTERTMVQVREVAQSREHGEVTVEGSARPVRVYEIVDGRQ